MPDFQVRTVTRGGRLKYSNPVKKGGAVELGRADGLLTLDYARLCQPIPDDPTLCCAIRYRNPAKKDCAREPTMPDVPGADRNKT